eukprot:3021280-Rhodomonas_salina.1
MDAVVHADSIDAGSFEGEEARAETPRAELAVDGTEDEVGVAERIKYWYRTRKGNHHSLHRHDTWGWKIRFRKNKRESQVQPGIKPRKPLLSTRAITKRFLVLDFAAKAPRSACTRAVQSVAQTQHALLCFQVDVEDCMADNVKVDKMAEGF